MIGRRSPMVEEVRPDASRLWKNVWNLVRSRPHVFLALGLLAIDLAFIGIQVAVDATDYGFNGAFRLSLETEHGVAQAFGWLQTGIASGLLYASWRRHPNPVAAFWSGALAYLMLDDAFTFHERLGHRLVGVFDLHEVGGLRGQDIGEAIAYILIMVVALGAFILAERKAESPVPSRLSVVMVPIGIVFLFFAVVLDILGTGVPIAIEDGGELVALSAFLVVASMWLWSQDDLADAGQ